MRPRIVLARFLIRIGKLMQSLAIMVMRPDDLVAFGRATYARPKEIEYWGSLDAELTAVEKELMKRIRPSNGRLLLLGVGGGREAICLAREGFDVTGVDFVPQLVERAIQNAAQNGLTIQGSTVEISKLDVPAGCYDVVWASPAMYSCVPTRARRVRMLRKIKDALRTRGYFVCQFHLDARQRFSPAMELLRRACAVLTLGNLWYEKGDTLWHDNEFLHAFPSEAALRSEFQEAGFRIVDLGAPQGSPRGWAVLRKNSTE